jgi:hypothetical protein
MGLFMQEFWSEVICSRWERYPQQIEVAIFLLAYQD